MQKRKSFAFIWLIIVSLFFSPVLPIANQLINTWNKMFMHTILIILFLLIFLIWNNSKKLKGWWYLMGFTIVSCILTNISILDGIGSSLYNIKGFEPIVLFFVLSMFVFSQIKSRKEVEQFTNTLPVFLIIGLVVRLFSLVFQIGILNKNTFSFILDLIIPLAWMGFLNKKGKLWNILLFTSLIFLVLTDARGALFSIAFVIIISFLSTQRITIRNSLIFIIGVFLSITSLFIIPESTLQRLVNSLDLQQFNAVTRFSMWNESLELYFSHPLFGIGFSNFQFYPNTYASWLTFATPNNNWVNVLMSTGSFGFLIYILSGVYILKLLFESIKRKDEQFQWIIVGILLGIIAISIHSFLDDTLFYSESLIILSILVGLSFRCFEILKKESLIIKDKI